MSAKEISLEDITDICHNANDKAVSLGAASEEEFDRIQTKLLSCGCSWPTNNWVSYSDTYDGNTPNGMLWIINRGNELTYTRSHPIVCGVDILYQVSKETTLSVSQFIDSVSKFDVKDANVHVWNMTGWKKIQTVIIDNDWNHVNYQDPDMIGFPHVIKIRIDKDLLDSGDKVEHFDHQNIIELYEFDPSQYKAQYFKKGIWWPQTTPTWDKSVSYRLLQTIVAVESSSIQEDDAFDRANSVITRG